jgi:hypothetical protein
MQIPWQNHYLLSLNLNEYLETLVEEVLPLQKGMYPNARRRPTTTGAPCNPKIYNRPKQNKNQDATSNYNLSKPKGAQSMFLKWFLTATKNKRKTVMTTETNNDLILSIHIYDAIQTMSLYVPNAYESLISNFTFKYYFLK